MAVSKAEQKWNKIYTGKTAPAGAAVVLTENAHLLPLSGKALDIASGAGGNSLWLAKRGLAVDAWDISSVALSIMTDHCNALNLNINPRQIDITANELAKDNWGLIVVAHYLDRTLAEAIVGALKPGGILCYQTFTREKVDSSGPGNPDYLLSAGELLSLFFALRVLAYRDEGTIGSTEMGLRNESYLVAQKPIAPQHQV